MIPSRRALAAGCAALACSASAALARPALEVLQFDAGSVSIGPFEADAAPGLAKHLRVTVSGARDAPAVAGKTRMEGRGLRFEPAFPFSSRVQYRLHFDHPGYSPLSMSLKLPAPDGDRPAAEVTAVYPSSEQLPQNLLKFYIHFSQPMSRGEAYENIRLLEINGKTSMVRDAFLELAEELWDADGKRLTVFFDPARVKRGLKPHLETGPPLKPDRRYRLEISPHWKDAQRRPLAKPFTMQFRTTAPDYRQPDPDRWVVKIPASGTREPLIAGFEAPLDHALLERLLEVRRAGKKRSLAGEASISEHETRWSFVPAEPWRAGDYRLMAGSELEDLAGNSIAKPFEVTPENPGRAFVGPSASRSFSITPAD